MIHGTENALLVHIVKNLWLGKDSLPEMTNPIAQIVLVNYSQSDVLPVPSQSQVHSTIFNQPLFFVHLEILAEMLANQPGAVLVTSIEEK